MWPELIKLAATLKLHHAPGWAAVLGLTYVHFIEVVPLRSQAESLTKEVQSLRRSSIEERLDKTYAALCMNPGDPAILERIRELQAEYVTVAQERYRPPDCTLLMKIR